jgi:prefoldin subunit 5
MEGRMTADERFDRLDRAIEELTQSTQALTQSSQSLTQYLLDFRQETGSHLQTIDNRLDILSSTVANLDSRIPAPTKAILDFGTLAAQLVREQSRQKDTATDLVTRVAKLEDIVSKLIEPAA